MNVTTDLQELDRFEREHADLEQQVQAWRQWWCELREMGMPHFNEMGLRLKSFRDQVAEHMRHEEASPYLQDLAHGNPDYQLEAAHLWNDHRRLLHDLDALIARLSACEPVYECWGAARQDFEAWLLALHTHEREETEWMRRLAGTSSPARDFSSHLAPP